MNNNITASDESTQSLRSHLSSQISCGTVRSAPTGFSISVSAPGKVILHGEHSVVYGKLAIAGSLGLRTSIKLQELQQNEPDLNNISIELKALNLQHNYNLTDIELNLLNHQLPLLKNSSHFNMEKPEMLNHDELLHFVETFVNKRSGSFPLNQFQQLSLSSLFYLFYGMFGSVNIKLEPFVLTIESELTLSAGTGSSASYLVCLAATFYQYIRKKLQLKENFSKNGYKNVKLETSSSFKTFDKTDLELISRWAYTAERIIHGCASGVDNTICTFGSLVEFRKSTGPKLVEMSHKLKILLVNTKVPRETKALVTLVATLREDHPVIVDCILEALNEIAQKALDCFISIGKNRDLKQTFDKLGELTDMNHNLLSALRVSHPTLDKICLILRECGLHGKLTGAGGGGYAIALVPENFEKSKLKDVIVRLEKEGFEIILTDLGGPGLTID